MFVPTIENRNLLNLIYSLIGMMDLILCPFTISLLLLPAPSYLKVFKRIQLAIIINSFLFALGFFILRPVAAIPFAIYSISSWNLSQEMMVVLLTLCATTFGLSLLFLLTTYLHRAVALAPLHWKKPLAVYYIIFSFLSNVIGICAIAYALNLCLSYNSVDPQFEAIRSFSEILYLEASFNVFLTNPALLPLCGIFLLTIIVTILLMYKFSVNASASKKTRQKQDLLFRLTLIQTLMFSRTFLFSITGVSQAIVGFDSCYRNPNIINCIKKTIDPLYIIEKKVTLFVLLTSIGLPALALFLSALGWLHLPEIFIFCIFAPLTMHSPGYCIAIICTPFYRKILRQWATKKKRKIGLGSWLSREKNENAEAPRVFLEIPTAMRRKNTL